MPVIVSALLALAICTGCQGQSRREALEIICDAPNHVDMSGSEPMALLFYIGERMKNDETLEWYEHTGEDDTDYAAQLRDMARAEGIASCPFTNYLVRAEPESRSSELPGPLFGNLNGESEDEQQGDQ